MSGILEGVKVLDFGRYIAGPFCGALLADYGAEVIRIERISGSEDRYVTPVSKDGQGAMFLQLNRNKLGLTLNPTKDKGQDITLKGLIPLLKNNKVHLFFIGEIDLSISGTQNMLNEMKELINQNKLSNSVHFTGYRKDIFDLMNCADLLVHTPRAEAFGLVLIESMYLGLPIISSNIEAIPEVLNGSETIVLEKNNAVNLQESIDYFFGLKSDEIKKIKHSGISHVKKFSPQFRAIQILKIYNNNYY